MRGYHLGKVPRKPLLDLIVTEGNIHESPKNLVCDGVYVDGEMVWQGVHLISLCVPDYLDHAAQPTTGLPPSN